MISELMTASGDSYHDDGFDDDPVVDLEDLDDPDEDDLGDDLAVEDLDGDLMEDDLDDDDDVADLLDDDGIDLDDVEADLEEILRARIAAGDDIDDDDDDDDDDDEDEIAPAVQKTPPGVAPPRLGEWRCDQCFLIVSASQFGSRSFPVCPSGEDPCGSIDRLLDG